MRKTIDFSNEIMCKVLSSIIILVSLFTAGDISAAVAKRLSGIVIDSITGERLPFANIISEKISKENKVADEHGAFHILTHDDGYGWSVSYTGYDSKPITITNSDTILIVRLSPTSHNLHEVVVKPGKEKYSKKNNPAVDFVNRLRKESTKHDPRKQPHYSYDKYEKTVLALNEFVGTFDKGFLAKQGKFLENYVDTSSWTGKRILDFIMKEKASTRLYSQNPGDDKEIIRGYRSKGIDEVLTQENLQVILEDAIREIDPYGNDVIILQNRLVSPLSAIGPDFYKYYLTDTVYIEDERCVELSFAPRNPESMGFNGKIYVPVGDTTMFVKKITMRTPGDINLNYLQNMFVNQTYNKDSLGNRHKTYDDVCIEMQILSGAPKLYGRKITTYDNFSYDRRADLSEYYGKLGRNFDMDKAREREPEFWDRARMIPLSNAEGRMEHMTKEMRKVPLFYWAEKFISLLESGYVKTGKPSKIDLGPVNTLLSFGDVEGMRIRLGGMTMSPLSKHFFASGYVAYGTKDRKFKYSANLEYSFKAKRHHSYEWPRHGIYATYTYDRDMLGQHYAFTSQDNIFLSLKRKQGINLRTYHRLAKFGYILELPNNFSVQADFKHEIQEATQWVRFRLPDGRELRNFAQSTVKVELRWAQGEKFMQGRTHRTPINMDAWIFQLSHEYGPKGLFGTPFTTNITELSVQKRIWMSAFGYLNIIAKAGKVWSSVYFPMLMWPNANLSYTIQPESYSLMNAMEFANDKYAAVDLTYFGNGVLFNRLPFLKKLKLREVVTFKGLMGGLSAKNNPAGNMNLIEFPAEANARVMTSTPYMEMGVGLDNIFTFLRVDYVWRLTYRNFPNIDRSGLRIAVHFSF